MSKEAHELKKAATAEVERIARNNGGKITATEIVEAASDPTSPMHSQFEWEDDQAAHKYRLIQARMLIRACKLEIKVHNRKMTVPKYLRDPQQDSTEQGYVETARIRTDEDVKRDALINEFSRIARMLTKARALASYFDMDEEIDSFTESLELMRRKITDSVELNA